MVKSLNVKTIVQALAILQRELKESNYMALIKHMFFSDRYHLRHYGFLYTSDTYLALKLGPVPSTTKDIVTFSSFLEEQMSKSDFNYLENSIEVTAKHDIKIHETNENHLSESIKEALNFSIKNFYKFDKFKLAEITHDYPEWKVFEEYFRVSKGKGSQSMDISKFFDNPDLENSPFINDYLKGIDPFADDEDFLAEMKEEYLLTGSIR